MGIVGRRMFFYHTVCEIILYEYEGNAEEILKACEDSARNVQRMLNIYDKTSELSLLNQNYLPQKPYVLSKELFYLLQSVWKFSGLCGGAFDMTVGSLVRLWDFTSPSPQIPTMEQSEEIRKKTGYEQISFDEKNCSIRIQQPGVVVDGGGFGKGYAVQRAVECLRQYRVKSATVNYGGNLFLLGSHPQNRESKGGWKVGIQRPWGKRGESLGILFLKDLGAATSASYERYFQVQGKRYGHILNPSSGRPAENNLQSVTIISDSPWMADLMSTAFFVLGVEKGDELVQKMKKCTFPGTYAWMPLQKEGKPYPVGCTFLEYVAITQEEWYFSEGAKALVMEIKK